MLFLQHFSNKKMKQFFLFSVLNNNLTKPAKRGLDTTEFKATVVDLDISMVCERLSLALHWTQWYHHELIGTVY